MEMPLRDEKRLRLRMDITICDIMKTLLVTQISRDVL